MICNTCIDELRRQKRHPCLPLDSQETYGDTVKVSQWSIHTRQTPEEALIQHEAWEWIEHCLHRLSELMPEVVILIDMESLDDPETAHILGIPIGTVKSRIGQARVRIRALLREVPFMAGAEQILID